MNVETASAGPAPARGASRRRDYRNVCTRVDCIEDSFRVELGAESVIRLRRAAERARRLGLKRGAVLLGTGRRAADVAREWGASGLRKFDVLVPRDDGGWFLQNGYCRVEVKLHGALAEDEEDVAAGLDPALRGPVGWNVVVYLSGVALLVMGLEAAIAEAWAIADSLGTVLESRIRRLDQCTDVAGYDLRRSDADSFVKQRRAPSRQIRQDGTVLVKHKKRVTTTGEAYTDETVTWAISPRTLLGDEDGKVQILSSGHTLSGLTFGARTAVSCRIYNKTLELRTPKDGERCGLERSAKRRAEFKNWRRNGWKGIVAEPDVTRVEFELRVPALRELDSLCITTPALGGAREQARRLRAVLDPLWAYCTRKWLRLVERGHKGPDRKPKVQARWRVVQSATFVAQAEPRKRERVRGGAQPSLVLGAALSVLAQGDSHVVTDPVTGACQDLGAIDYCAGEPLELVSRTTQDVLPELARRAATEDLRGLVRGIAAATVDPIVQYELERADGDPRRASARVRLKAASAIARASSIASPAKNEEAAA